MKIFETHAHLDFTDYDNDRDLLLKKCFNAGIEFIINIGTDEKSSRNSVEMSEKYDKVYAAVGYHPHDVENYDEDVIRELAKYKKVVAIGEIGLDYYRNLSPKKIQKEVFARQIELAIAMHKPIIVHDRNAHEDTLDILQQYKPDKVVFHCFSGDELMADKIIEQGWKISFTGVVTFKNSNMENIIRRVPSDGYFIETDSPFLTPVPFRGKRNSPLNLRYIIEKISEIRNQTPKMVAKDSFNNACNFFFSKE